MKKKEEKIQEVVDKLDRKHVPLYDPPSGWQYGFPKPYKPLKGESIEDTLRRDGYPEHLLEQGLAKHTRFIGLFYRDAGV